MKGIAKGMLFSALVLGVALVGCSRGGHEVKPTGKAVAVMNPTEGSKVKGFVSFEKTGKGVRVVADLNGLAPGPHGFHIHEYGDCSSPDAGSAGGHFNPTGMPHAAPNVDKRHEGDLGNVEADKSGHARLEITDKKLTLEGPNSIIGRAVVVHAQADDFKSQPAGNSGARIACGVIGIAK